MGRSSIERRRLVRMTITSTHAAVAVDPHLVPALPHTLLRVLVDVAEVGERHERSRSVASAGSSSLPSPPNSSWPWSEVDRPRRAARMHFMRSLPVLASKRKSTMSCSNSIRVLDLLVAVDRELGRVSAVMNCCSVVGRRAAIRSRSCPSPSLRRRRGRRSTRRSKGTSSLRRPATTAITPSSICAARPRRPGDGCARRDAAEHADLGEPPRPLDRLPRPDDDAPVEQLVAVVVEEDLGDEALVEVLEAVDHLADRRLDGPHLTVGVLTP